MKTKAIRNTIIDFFSMESSLFRYSLSYSFLFALLPTLLILVLMIQLAVIPLDSVFQYLYQFFPEDLIKPFITYIAGLDSTGLLATIVSILVASFLASKSFYSFMLISATKEDVDYYKILIRFKSYVLFIVFIMGITAFIFVLNILDIYIPFFFIFFLTTILTFFYRLLSFIKRPLNYGVVGALIVSVAIYIISVSFFYIIGMFTDYGSIYGPLASLVILLVSIQLISSDIYFGYCFNNHYYPLPNQIVLKNYHHYLKGQSLIDKLKLIFSKSTH